MAQSQSGRKKDESRRRTVDGNCSSKTVSLACGPPGWLPAVHQDGCGATALLNGTSLFPHGNATRCFFGLFEIAE